MMNLSNDLEIQQTIGIHEYFTFLFKLTIPFGFLFQLPIVVLFFSRIGILSPELLIRIRKYCTSVYLYVPRLLQPPELASHLMVSVPLFILYEISIMISRIGYKKYLKSEEIRLKEEQEAEQKRQIEEALEQRTTTNRRIESTVIIKLGALNGTPSFVLFLHLTIALQKFIAFFEFLKKLCNGSA